MSELEDRILKIVELRASGLDDRVIARRLEIDVTVLGMYENSFRKNIEGLVGRGIYGLGNVALQLGISPVVLKMYSDVYGIEIPEDKVIEKRQIASKESREERISDIRKVISDGAKTAEEIAKRVGLTSTAVRGYAYRWNIKLHTRAYIKKEKALELIKDASDKGAKTAREIAEKTGLNLSRIYELAKVGEIELLKGKGGRPVGGGQGTKRRSEIDELIEKGLTLKEIGKNVKLTHERIRQYINATGQYDFYRQKRKEVRENLGIGKEGRKKMDNLRGWFLSAVRTRAEELAQEEDWASQKAVEYLHSYKHKITSKRNYSFNTLYKIFSRYENAKKKGKKLTLAELAKGLDIWQHSVGRILEEVGVEPMYGKVKMKIKYRGEKKEAVKRGLETIFSSLDIAYFLGLPEHVPGNRYDYLGVKREAPQFAGVIDRDQGNLPEFLSYRLASEIYEARDCGFNKKKITELVGKGERLVDYALQHRAKIEPQIVKGLRVLYNDSRGRVVKKPYVTPEMKEKLEKEEMQRFTNIGL